MAKKYKMKDVVKNYWFTDRPTYIMIKKVMDLHRKDFPDWADQEMTKKQLKKFQKEYVEDEAKRKYYLKTRKKTRTRKNLYTIGASGNIIDTEDAVTTEDLPELKVFK